MGTRVLGIDIGISSIGYALIEKNEENMTGKIIKTGVRIFTEAENPKDGKSLALPRREARSARRRLFRRAFRLKRIKNVILKFGLVSEVNLDDIFIPKSGVIDVWNLRKQALERILKPDELARILIHIAKRRGFKSIRKSEEEGTQGELLKAIHSTREKLAETGFKTVGQMFGTIYTDGEAKRNKRDTYKNSIPRNLLEEEIKTIFAIQRELNNNYATEELEKKYIEIAFYQNPLKSVENMVRNCTFEPSEKRAPKRAYTSEKFTAATKLVNLMLIDNSAKGNSRFLDPREINDLIETAHEKVKITYEQVRKSLDLDKNITFKGLNYGKADKNPESAIFIELKGYHDIRKAVEKELGEEFWQAIKYDKNLFNNIAVALTFEKSDEAIEKRLQDSNINPNIINAVKNLSMNKVMHLSITAMDNIIPYMFEGLKYNKACEEAGYDFKKTIQNRGLTILPPLGSEERTVNPVVNRAVAQFRKVINAIIREYGAFDQLNIEMARDLSKNFVERRRIIKDQEEYKQNKEQAEKRCLENNIDPNFGSNLLKFRLLEEQGGYCLYSGSYIDPTKLIDESYTDIDHILPYSRSLDNSLNNKTLCLASENRQKGNKTPYEYIINKSEQFWEEFVARVNNANLRTAKKNRLLRKSFTRQDSVGFRERNLNDTRYICRYVKEYVKENLDFGKELKVETRNGSLTAFLRHQWGLSKNREENDKHHALDAIVVACATQGMVQYLSTISRQREGYKFIHGSKPRFKAPWESFRQNVQEAVDGIFVSRAPRNKVTCALHEETIRSAKYIDQGFTVLKTPIGKVNLKTLENLFDKERNIAVYNALKERLEQFNDNPEKAFAEPVYMPLSEEKIQAGQKPHQIKSVKIKTVQYSGVPVRNGIADNGGMIRVDVFSKKNKKGKDEFYLVPVYLADFGKQLPNKAIVAHKPE